MSILAHPRAPEAAALVAPVVAVALFRLLSPSAAPASALAREPAPSVNPAALAASVPAASKAAAEFARASLAQPLGASPFLLPYASTTIETEPEPDESEPAQPAPVAPVFVVDASHFILTSVMTSNSGAVVVLNGRLYRLHDSPGTGWKITNINPTKRTATLTHESGESRTLSLTTPIAPQR
ncbi:MAG: hypothetical protein AB7G17_01755 [Phycisphaerales bacterium]